jgi:AhpD family alkylhydroperoxidase
MVTTTTRFPAHTPHTATGRAADLLGRLWARHGDQVSEMVRTMAGSPALLGGYLDFSRAMKRSRLPRRTAEAISIAIQSRLACALCLAAHIAAGRAAGLTDDDIALAVAGTATDPATASLVTYAIAVHADPASIDAHLLAELRSFGHRDRDLLDVIGLVTLNHLTGAFNLVAGLEPEEPMNTTTRLAAYGGVLAASFAGAAGIGATVGPIDTGGQAHVVSGGHDPGGHDADAGTNPPPTVTARSGTSLDAAGVRIDPDRITIAARTATNYTFRLVDEHGTAITDYDVVHDRPLHLIVASRDLTAYHHLHPEQDGDTWSVALPALDPGTYRVFADSRPTDRTAVTLGVDLLVVDDVATGNPPPVDTSSAVDGFDVTLVGTPGIGNATLSFTVRRNGSVVTTEPYLGAAGHLVVLRAGDLAYVHAHADHQSGDGEHDITFDVSFPTAGTYRLFLDFAVDGTVHTADFTVHVPDADTPANTATHEGH